MTHWPNEIRILPSGHLEKNMTAKTKVENYTAAQTAKMVADYTAAPSKATVEAIAAEMGKTVRSVIAKLSREKAYIKAERVTKTGEPIAKKDETADAIGAVLSLTEAEVTSLTKANKTALKKIFAALAASRPIDGDE
jgi:response regulator RpfG family c-di-GMP phosphodiesterase